MDINGDVRSVGHIRHSDGEVVSAHHKQMGSTRWKSFHASFFGVDLQYGEDDVDVWEGDEQQRDDRHGHSDGEPQEGLEISTEIRAGGLYHCQVVTKAVVNPGCVPVS